MWAGSAEVSILREALGEALVVFCMTFVGIVGMFKLAERSIERSIHVALLPMPVLGGREKGAARDTRGRGEVTPQHLDATGARRRGPHDERGEVTPQHLDATGARRRGPLDATKSKGPGSVSGVRHSASRGAMDEMRHSHPESRSASTKSKGPGSVSGMRHSASCGAMDEMRHSRSESRSASTKSKGPGSVSGMRHSASCGAMDEMRHRMDFLLSLSGAERSGALHSSSSGSIRPPRRTILWRNMSTTSLDSIEEVPSDSDASSPRSIEEVPSDSDASSPRSERVQREQNTFENLCLRRHSQEEEAQDAVKAKLWAKRTTTCS